MTLHAATVAALLSLFLLACGGQSKSAEKSDATSTDGTGGTDSATTGTTGTDSATTGHPGVCKELPSGAVATNSPSCPSYEPAGDCSEVGLVCEYDYCVFPDYYGYTQATCVDGRWEFTLQRECDPPTCPAVPPVIGAACDDALTPGPCEFLNACQDSLPAYCRAGVWETECSEIETPPALGADSSCPSYPPNVGDPCCPRWLAPWCDFSKFLEDWNGTASVGAATGGSGGPVWTPTGPLAECVSCNPDSFVWEESNECE